MAGRERSNTDAIDCVCRIEIDGFNQRKCRQVVMFGIKSGTLIGRRCCVADPYIVLNEPFVDSLGRMRHKDTAFEVRLAEDIRESGGMINVKTK